jgi:hypothetical protein
MNSVLFQIFSFTVFLILGMYSRYLDTVNTNYIASLLNKHHTSQYLCLLQS